MITWFSDTREGSPIVQRLQDEGVKVDYFVADRHYRKCFRGIIPQITLSDLKQSLKRNEVVVFDINKVNDPKNPYCKELLRYFGCKTNSKGVFGPIADKLKRDHLVICGSEYCDHIEFDRLAGIELAKRIGIRVSDSHEFTNLQDGVNYLTGKDKCYVLKLDNNEDLSLTYVEEDPGELILKMTGELPERLGRTKVRFILQEVVDGTEISTEAWFDGENFVAWNHSLEDKRFLVGNLGINTGCQSNTSWPKTDESGLLVKEIKKLKPYLVQAGYVGCIDINAIICKMDNYPYFLEFTPRFGYSAIYCLLSLVPEGGLGNFFMNGFRFIPNAKYACSQLVSIPPYPYGSPTDLRKMAQGVVIGNSLKSLKNFWMQDVLVNENGALECAGVDANIGVMVGTGNTLEDAVDKMYENINKLKIAADFQYRVDHLKSHTKRLNKLKAMGVNVT